MNDRSVTEHVEPSGSATVSLETARRIDEICNQFERAFHDGQEPRIETERRAFDGDVAACRVLFRSLVELELELRFERGEQPPVQEYTDRFPDDADVVADVFAAQPTRTHQRRVPYEISRGLLLGLMAVQHGFAGREAVLASLQSWLADRSQTLAALLTRQDRLAPRRLALLEALVEDHVGQHGGDAGAAFSAAHAGMPAAAFLHDLTDPEVQSCLGKAGPWVGAAGPDPHSGADRYVIGPILGRGGLGVVYLAQDRELDRSVAVKEIKPRIADRPDVQAMFVAEAQITGGLEHPGIVPVHSLGRHDDGRPFYAMRVVRNETLRDAIERFHEADRAAAPRDRSERALALRELLGRFIDVCDAIEYAHHRGILHRDIKPGNVLLGHYGETLVVDWGLAKFIARVEDSRGPAEPTLRPGALPGSGQGVTQQGSVKGTPGYMSPEQATGKIDSMGTWSDVYSLGATLYKLVTGRSPLKGVVDSALRLEMIVTGTFPRPREANPRVPAPLEAVCLKAMQTDPAHRYGSARALADDIKHWLADEPVGAYREPWGQRLGRWARRHRTWVQAAAAALVMVAVVATAAALAVNRSYHSEQRARAGAIEAYHREQQARQQSDTNFATARAAINRLYSLASRDLPALPLNERLRLRLAQEVVAAYDELLKSRSDDQSVRREAALADLELAHVLRFLGQVEPARKSYDRALARLRRLVAEPPVDPRLRFNLAICLGELAVLHRMTGQTSQAETILAEGRDVSSRLRAEFPDDLRFIRSEGYVLENQAIIQLDVGRYKEAEQNCAQALDFWKALAASPRVNPASDPLHVINCQARMGTVRRWLGDAAGAREAYEQALALAEQRAEKNKNNPDFLAEFSSVRNAMGDFLLETDPRRAASLFQGAFEHMRLVVNNHRLVPAYRRDLAVAQNGLGAARLASGLLDDARARCAEARTLLETLVREVDIPIHRYSLARTLANQARIARAAHQTGEARDLFRAALKEHAHNLAIDPRSVFDQRYQERCRQELAALESPPGPGPGPAAPEPGTPP
jgi:serine/threonine-protein kinase